MSVERRQATRWRDGGGVGIRGRLAVLLIGALMVVLGTAGALLVDRQTADAYDEANIQAATLVRTLSVPCSMALASGELEALDGYVAEVARAETELMRIRVAGMLDHRGRLIARAAPGRGRGGGGSGGSEDSGGSAGPARSLGFRDFLERASSSAQALWQRLRLDDGALVLYVSVPAVSGLRWGTLFASFDLTQLESRLEDSRRTLVAVGLGFTAAVLLALYLGLSWLVVRPLGRLARVAATIEAGDLRARAPASSEDELGRLGRAFNGMASRLQNYTSGLENVVESHSAELESRGRELQELRLRLESAEAALERTETLDRLTGLQTRHRFMERLDAELTRSARSGQPLVVALLDVDHFESVNATRGVLAGDRVLAGVAELVRDELRVSDVAARYAEDELVVLLLDTDSEAAGQAAEKIRLAVAAASWPCQDGRPDERVTVSIGLAGFPQAGNDATTLVEAAKSALRRAKTAGRNRWIDCHAR